MGVTTLLRADGVLLGQMLIEVFGPTPEFFYGDLLAPLKVRYPEVKFAPTLACWKEAVQLFEAHLNDEADELIDSLDNISQDTHEYNIEQS